MERLRYLRLTGRQRVGIWLTLLVLALLAAAVSLLWHLKPVMTSMATARVSNLVNRIVSPPSMRRWKTATLTIRIS